MELCPGTVGLEGGKGKLRPIKVIPSTVDQQLMPSHHYPFELGNEPGISLQTLVLMEVTKYIFNMYCPSISLPLQWQVFQSNGDKDSPTTVSVVDKSTGSQVKFTCSDSEL